MAARLNLHSMRDRVAKHLSKTTRTSEKTKVAHFINHKHPSLLSARPSPLVIGNIAGETAKAVSGAALKRRASCVGGGRNRVRPGSLPFGSALDVTKLFGSMNERICVGSIGWLQTGQAASKSSRTISI